MEMTIGLDQDHEPLVVALAAFVMFVLGIVSALDAIMKTRSAQGAVAWVILLVAFPPLTVPLYWVFGRRKFRGYTKARRKGKLEIQLLAVELTKRLRGFAPAAVAQDRATAAVERLATLPFTRNNDIRLLINGHRAFLDIFEAIRQARHYVLLEFYIVRDDELGQSLKALLSKKVAEGVAVYFLYDEIGCFQLPRRYLRDLAGVGVDIRSFHTTKGLRNRFQLNFRNHRKIVVVDGEYATVGGVNVGSEYLDKHPVLTPWRDTNVAVEGPAVQAIQLAFVEDWFWASDRVPDRLNWEPREAPGGASDTLILASGPADVMDSCALYFINLINRASRRLWIVSPYFVPDAAVVAALQLAALRGVDVRVLLPDLADKQLIKLASFAYIEETTTSGVKFYHYRRGFMHQKVLLMDDDYVSIGSANLDNRSFSLNFEISVLSRSRALATDVERMLESDFENSRRLSRDEARNRPLWLKLASRCARLLAPVL